MSWFTRANKTVVSTGLSESRMKSQEFCKDVGMYGAYVLVEYPIRAAHEALMLNTRVRSSQSLESACGPD
jgi:hypothetical protein